MALGFSPPKVIPFICVVRITHLTLWRQLRSLNPKRSQTFVDDEGRGVMTNVDDVPEIEKCKTARI